MNKKFFLIVLFCPFLSFRAKAQNLILNPSFEDTITCPFQNAQIDFSVGWSSYGETPDYLNGCGLSCPMFSQCTGVPLNFAGFQSAYSGNAYGGIATYCENSLFREFIGTQLIQPLSIGKKYYVSGYFSRGYTSFQFGASNNLGFRFFTVPFSINFPCPIDNYATINTTTIISDTINWTEVKGSFIADSAYQYLAIGNFYDDLHTDTADIKNNSMFINYAYYYVDLVCVTEDSLNCTPITGIKEIKSNNFSIYPNPATEKATIKNGIIGDEFSIYSLMGELIFTKIITSTNEEEIEIGKLKSGVYVIKINNTQNLKFVKL